MVLVEVDYRRGRIWVKMQAAWLLERCNIRPNRTITVQNPKIFTEANALF